MRGSVAAVFLIAWTAVFLRPVAGRLLPDALRSSLLLTLTSAALGCGAITLVAMWAMVVWPGGPVFPVAFLLSIVVFACGLLAFGWPRAVSTPVPASDLPRAFRAICAATAAVIALGIVFDAVYWPFENGDALTLYALFGRHMLETRTLPHFDGITDAYPMLVPTTYAMVQWAYGGLNEYLSRLAAGLLGVLAIGAAGALGAAAGSTSTGWIAAALVACTPVFGRWASTGYTDVPAGFFVAMAACFAIYWRQSDDRRLLALAAVMAALATWTKNSTLACLPGLAWLVITTPPADDARSVRARLTHIAAAGALVAGAIGLIAAPWYLRSQLLFGHAVPPTAFVDLAQHNWRPATVMLRPGQFFGASGWLFVLGFITAIAAIWRRQDRSGSRAVLLAFSVPVYLAWWWIASYEGRFLMIVVPVMAALGALGVEDVRQILTARLGVRSLRAWSIAAGIGIVIAGGVALRKTVEHKEVLVRTPWPSDEERHRVRLRGLWDVIQLANNLPEGARLGGVPPGARYHIHSDRVAQIGFGNFAEPLSTYAGRFDLVIYRNPPAGTAVGHPRIMQTPDGFAAYAVEDAPVPAIVTAR